MTWLPYPSTTYSNHWRQKRGREEMYTHFFTALFVRCPPPCHLERSCMAGWKRMVLFYFASESRDLLLRWNCAAVRGDFFTALFVRCPPPCHLERSCMPLWKRMVLFCFVSESRDLPCPWDCAAVKGNFFMAPISLTANYFLYPASARKARFPASRFTRKEAQAARMTWSRRRAHQVPISPMSST